MAAGSQHLKNVHLQVFESASNHFSQEGDGNRPSCQTFPEPIWKQNTHLVKLPNTLVCMICSLLQGNVWPHSLSRTALHKTEKRGCLKARNGTGVREFAAWVDWSCSYLCLWQTISPREHIIFLISASSVSLRSSFFQGKIPKPHIPFPDSF